MSILDVHTELKDRDNSIAQSPLLQSAKELDQLRERIRALR